MSKLCFDTFCGFLCVGRKGGKISGYTYLNKKPRGEESQTTVLSIEAVMIRIEGKVVQIKKPENHFKSFDFLFWCNNTNVNPYEYNLLCYTTK